MSQEELLQQESIEQKNKSQNDLHVNIDEVKDNVLNILDCPKESDIISMYKIWEDKKYNFLLKIENLSLYIKFLSDLYWFSKDKKIDIKILKKYKKIGQKEELIKKSYELWLWIYRNDIKTPLTVKWRYEDNTDLTKFQIINNIDFLEQIDLEKIKSISNFPHIDKNSNYFSFIITNDPNYRKLLTTNFDKYIQLLDINPWLTYEYLKEENYWRDDLFYNLLEVDDLELFFDSLINLWVQTNLEDEMFVYSIAEFLDFDRVYWKQWYKNLNFINNHFKNKITIKDILDNSIHEKSSMLLIDSEILKKVYDLVWEEKLHTFTRLLDNYNDINDNYNLLQLLYKNFWDPILEEDELLSQFMISWLKDFNLDRWFLRRFWIEWEDWIKLLKFISFTNVKKVFLNYIRLVEKVPDLFHYKNFIKYWLDELIPSLNALLNFDPDIYAFMFEKYQDDFLKDKKWFIKKISEHCNVNFDWEGLKNIEHVENIFKIHVSYDDFVKFSDVFLIWWDLRESFEYLRWKFYMEISSLDDLREFNPFYSKFSWDSLKEHHKFFIDKLWYTKNDLKNKDFELWFSEFNMFKYTELEDALWEELLNKYLWKKDKVLDAISPYLVTFIVENKNLLENIIVYLWKKSKYTEFNKLINIFNWDFVLTKERVIKIERLIELDKLEHPNSFIKIFIDTKTIEEENQILLHYEKVIDDLIELNSINTNYWFEEELIDQVYNWVSSYTPRTLEEYEDKSEHLEWYKFYRNWYKMIFSWLSWYKLREWEDVDEELMSRFDKRVERIRELSIDNWAIERFIYQEFDKYNFNSTIVSKEALIIQYLKFLEDKKWKLDIEDMDVAIAYQLLWKFEDFVNWSNDKISKINDEYSKNAFKLEALINEYWDNLKETINLLEKRVIEAWDEEDIELLATKQESIEGTDEYKNLTKNRVLEQIIKSFINIPEDKLNQKILEKSLTTRFKTILQKNSHLKNKVEDLVSMFSVDDFKWLREEENKSKLKEKLKYNVLNFLTNNHKIDLDLKAIQELQWKIYTVLKHENDKYEEIKEVEEKSDWKLVEKSSKDRNVMWYFAKTKEQAKARGVGWICIWVDKKMWQNPNYFEFVLMDIDRKVNIWTTMLLHLEDNNKKYLLFWPNPSEEFTGKVSAKDLYYQIIWKVSDFAENNWYDWIILNAQHWRSTNRWWSFQTVLENSVLKDDNWKKIVINLQKSHKLWWGYEYKDWLNFVWKK